MRGIYIGFFFILGILVLIGAAVSGVLSPYEDVSASEMPVHILIISMWGLLGLFGLWLWMIVDFFRRTHLKHKLYWGLGLLFAHILAAIPYFLFIYIPWARKPSGERLPLDSEWQQRPTGFTVLSILFILIGSTGLLGVIGKPYPVELKIAHVTYALSLVAFAIGLWRISTWVVKASWFWLFSLMFFTVAMNYYSIGFPLLYLLGTIAFLGLFAGLIVWYVSRTMAARAEAALRNA